MNLWPVSLQEKVNTDGFSYKFGKTTIETDMDVGITKKRRLYTKSVDELSITINVNSTEYATLYTFFDTTLNGGALTFWHDNPITGVSEEFRFKGEPQLSPLGGVYFRVDMIWQRIPV